MGYWDGLECRFGAVGWVKRGFKTRERVPFSGGLSGVEFVSKDVEVEVEVEAEAGPSRTVAAPELPLLIPSKTEARLRTEYS
jgi:hypothetical protein